MISRIDQRPVFATVGLGYVGLPLAQAAAQAGLAGVGYDVSPRVVESLNAGLSHVDDLSDGAIHEMAASGFRFTSNLEDLRGVATYVICVPTPLSAEGGPDLSAVINAAEALSKVVAAGALVILESTTWPGTTEEVLVPILERSGLRVGQDLNVAYSPERIDPGNATYGIANTPKVIGGITPACGDRAEAFYGTFVNTVVRARGTREAEMAKLLENTYRQVNIALVNEMVKFSHELDIDLWNVIECASTKPFGFASFHPGPGVGGHCIPIDPSYLSHRVQAQLGYPFRFVELAQEINRSMPSYVAHRAQQLLNEAGLPVRGARILLLGVTYKAGISDQRESPSIQVAEYLIKWGAYVSFYDHFVKDWHCGKTMLTRVEDLNSVGMNADLVIHLQEHPDYDSPVVSAWDTRVLDTRGVFDGTGVSRL